MCSASKCSNSIHCRGEENHMTFKGAFPPATCTRQMWCDIIEPMLPGPRTFARIFIRPPGHDHEQLRSARPFTSHMSHQHFYEDLVVWLRQICNIQPLLKVPTPSKSACARRKHPHLFPPEPPELPVRIQFYKPCTLPSPAPPLPAISTSRPRRLVLDDMQPPNPELIPLATPSALPVRKNFAATGRV